MTEQTTTEEKDTPEEVPSFEELGLTPPLLEAVKRMGFERPMLVQAKTYQLIKDGRDIMVQSRTGSGKTAAFGIPTIEKIEQDKTHTQAMMLAPTRELALQVANELQNIVGDTGITVVPLYGGAAMNPQITALRESAQIVVGTPGRVLDHLLRKNLNPSQIATLVLDECDEMLSMGFQEEIDQIISKLPNTDVRQTLLFSATIPREIERIAKSHMGEPEHVVLSDGGVSVTDIDHRYYVVNGMARLRDLTTVLETEKPDHTIIFCNTRDETSSVARYLQRHGYNALAISSDLSQRERERVMGRMRKGEIQYMVATDVAARGIDIVDLSHVINYTFPDSPETYVHRTGRTGRAGKQGIAVSLVGPREIGSFYNLKLTYKIQPEEHELPSAEDIKAKAVAAAKTRILAETTESATTVHREVARELLAGDSGERLFAALIARALNTVQPERAPAPEKQEQRTQSRKAQPDAKSEGDEAGGRKRKRRRSRSAEHGGSEAREPARAKPADDDRPDSARLYLNVGKREGLKADDIRTLLRDTVGDGENTKIGSVALRATHCYVRVPETLIDSLVTKLHGSTFKERELVVERARR